MWREVSNKISFISPESYKTRCTRRIELTNLYFRKDARLPEMLQRAMAAEAEASREARAKVCIFEVIQT